MRRHASSCTREPFTSDRRLRNCGTVEVAFSNQSNSRIFGSVRQLTAPSGLRRSKRSSARCRSILSCVGLRTIRVQERPESQSTMTWPTLARRRTYQLRRHGNAHVYVITSQGPYTKLGHYLFPLLRCRFDLLVTFCKQMNGTGVQHSEQWMGYIDWTGNRVRMERICLLHTG